MALTAGGEPEFFSQEPFPLLPGAVVDIGSRFAAMFDLAVRPAFQESLPLAEVLRILGLPLVAHLPDGLSFAFWWLLRGLCLFPRLCTFLLQKLRIGHETGFLEVAGARLVAKAALPGVDHPVVPVGFLPGKAPLVLAGHSPLPFTSGAVASMAASLNTPFTGTLPHNISPSHPQHVAGADCRFLARETEPQLMHTPT